jgi:hypothetical protein
VHQYRGAQSTLSLHFPFPHRPFGVFKDAQCKLSTWISADLPMSTKRYGAHLSDLFDNIRSIRDSGEQMPLGRMVGSIGKCITATIQPDHVKGAEGTEDYDITCQLLTHVVAGVEKLNENSDSTSKCTWCNLRASQWKELATKGELWSNATQAATVSVNFSAAAAADDLPPPVVTMDAAGAAVGAAAEDSREGAEQSSDDLVDADEEEMPDLVDV